MALSDVENLQPSFPPLFHGLAVGSDQEPFEVAVKQAKTGTDPGLVVYRIRPDHLAAALVLAPETSLADAIAMVLVAAVGFADSFGSLAPSEVAVHFDWPGGFRVNGARCGGLRVAASTDNAKAEPDWLVIGLDVPFFAQAAQEPGATPDHTTLWDEGCSDIDPCQLLESWSRHTLVWIHSWTEDGLVRLHTAWTGRAFGIGTHTEVTLAGRSYSGEFMGLDENGGMLLKTGDKTRLLPLTMMLEEV